MRVLICSGEMPGMGYQKDCLGRRITGFIFRDLWLVLLPAFSIDNIYYLHERKSYSPPPQTNFEKELDG